MITFEYLTNLDYDVFDSMFDHSFVHMENGTMPWFLWPPLSTYEEKHNFVRTLVEDYLAHSLVLQIMKDDYPVAMLCCGKNPGEDCLYIESGLIRPDVSGSKSYLYSLEFMQARDDFCVNNNITEWVVTTFENSSVILDHFNKVQSAGLLGMNMEEIPEMLFPVFHKIKLRFYK